MSFEKRKFPYSFFTLLTQLYEFPAPTLTYFHIVTILLPLNVTSFSKRPYFTAQIKITSGCIGRFSKKKNTMMYPGPSRQLKWKSLWYQLAAFSR